MRELDDKVLVSGQIRPDEVAGGHLVVLEHVAEVVTAGPGVNCLREAGIRPPGLGQPPEALHDCIDQAGVSIRV